jgi:hypothetical protein
VRKLRPLPKKEALTAAKKSKVVNAILSPILKAIYLQFAFMRLIFTTQNRELIQREKLTKNTQQLRNFVVMTDTAKPLNKPF